MLCRRLIFISLLGLSLSFGQGASKANEALCAAATACSTNQSGYDQACLDQVLAPLNQRLSKAITALEQTLRDIDLDQQPDALPPLDLFRYSQSFWAQAQQATCTAASEKDSALCLCETLEQRALELENALQDEEL